MRRRFYCTPNLLLGNQANQASVRIPSTRESVSVSTLTDHLDTDAASSFAPVKESSENRRLEPAVVEGLAIPVCQICIPESVPRRPVASLIAPGHK